MASDSILGDREQRVDEAIAAYLEALNRGPVERAEFLARYPDLSDELSSFIADHERFRRFAAPLAVLGDQGSRSTIENAVANTAPAPRAPGDLPNQLADYELLEEIARGGMGVVYKARQRSLNRVVALKMILAGRQASPSDVQRFRIEAELAARLDHPGIVPIYEIGACEGTPYFSMKLIAGSNLSTRAPCWREDPRAAARLLARVARAVHHAHQRGLLHRDLKPANVLLDQQGNPYVTDFGLAKLQEHDSGLTPSGGIVGTPRYMAPEQATSKAALTTASDVYGLGCILYEIITGQPPIHEATPAETLLAVMEKEPARPRGLNPRIPLDLETICLKCLEKDANRRYHSADALADDLDRFVNDEPIHARHIGAAGRLVRWCRRRPVVAALSAALVTGSIAALVALTLLWRQAETNLQDKENEFARAEANRIEADAQKDLARRQQAQAERALRQTHRAIREFCIELGTKKLTGVPGMEPVRRKLLEGAVKQYEQLVQERGNDPILVAELAATHAWIAELDAQADRPADALAGYRKAAAGLEQVLAIPADQLPKNLIREAVAADAGRVQHRLAILLDQTGQPAEETYLKARGLFAPLVERHPDNLDYVTDLNAIETNLAGLYRKLGQAKKARLLVTDARARIEKQRRAHPTEKRLQANLIHAQEVLAALDKDEDNQRTALERYEETLKKLTLLAADNPTRLDYQHDLARCHRDLARAQRAANNGQAAFEHCAKARGLLVELLKQDGSVAAYRADLADVHRQLGLLHKQKNEKAQALESFQRGREELEKLIEKEPAPAYERQLAEAYVEMAALLAGNRQFREAATCYQQARALRGRLVEKQPADGVLRGELGSALAHLGQVYFNDGQRDEGLKTLRLASVELRQAVKDAPQDKTVRNQASFGFRALGEIAAKTGNLSEGVEAQIAYRDLYPGSPAEQYNAARELALIASWVGKGKPALSKDDLAERERYARLALDTLQEAARCGFKDADRLKKDAYFQALREHADFKAVLARLSHEGEEQGQVN